MVLYQTSKFIPYGWGKSEMIVIIFCYVVIWSAVSFLCGLIMLYYAVKAKLGGYASNAPLAHMLNHLRGRKLVLFGLQLFFGLGLLGWFIICFIMFDAVGSRWVTTFSFSGLGTPLGFIPAGLADYFYLAMLLGIVGAKFTFPLFIATNILYTDYIGVGPHGNWGPLGSRIDRN